MINKKISIITVVKNGMPYLKNSIKSFKLQNYNNKELIIVYSKSNDETESFLNDIKDENIFIKKDETSENRYGSILKGIKFASGEIFGLLHSDDIFYDENVLDIISKEFDKDLDCVYGNILFCEKRNIKKINRVWISNPYKKTKLKYGWSPPHTSIFLKKNFFQENSEIYNEKFNISGDYFFILKLFQSENLKCSYINNFITLMRSGGDSTNLLNFYDKFKEDLEISKIFFKNNYLCIILKIFRKINQIKLIKKNINNNYLKNFIL